MPATDASGGTAPTVVDAYSGLARPLDDGTLVVCGSAAAATAPACLSKLVLKTGQAEVALTVELGGGARFDRGSNPAVEGSIGPAISVTGNASVLSAPITGAQRLLLLLRAARCCAVGCAFGPCAAALLLPRALPLALLLGATRAAP